MEPFNLEMNSLKAEILRLENEKKQRQESVDAVEAAKTVFKRFRSDPTNKSAFHWSKMTMKTTVTDSFVIKINEYLGRVGFKIERYIGSKNANLFYLIN